MRLQINNHEALVREASEPALKGVMSQLLTALLDARIASLAQGAQISKSINMITVKLVECGEPTNVMLALMRLLREALQAPTCPNPKFTELVMKVRVLLQACRPTIYQRLQCLWKQCRRIEALASELRIGAILLESHAFFQVRRTLLKNFMCFFTKGFPCGFIHAPHRHANAHHQNDTQLDVQGDWRQRAFI